MEHSFPSLETAFGYIDQLVKLRMDQARLPGWAIAVTDREQLRWVSTYGFADVKSRIPITAESLFETGSIGKSFTCIALLQLREEGVLDLHAPVSRYLPWFQVKSNFPPISAHQLMRHSAGIIRGTEQAPYGLYDCWALRESETSAPPGDRWHYSSVGYKVLGFLLERLAGLTYAEIIQSRVLHPLGMSHSFSAVTLETRKVSTVGYRGFYDDRPQHPTFDLVPSLWSEYATADGCQLSTPGDIARYLRLLLNRGRGPQGALLSEESFRLMIEPGQGTGNDHYSYALARYPIDGHTYIGHGGATTGYNNFIMVDLESGLGVVSLVNKMEESDAVEATTIDAMKALREAANRRDLPPLPPPNDPASVANAADYAGSYHRENEVLRLTADNSRLLLHYGDQRIALERRNADAFYVDHPDFALFLLEFHREAGKVVEAFHGDRWYVNPSYSGPRHFDSPAGWEACTGHYRTRNPELSNFRVVIRKGSLFLILPWGLVEPLVPLGEDFFRIGLDSRSPETLRFRARVDGRALRADFSGCPYYRTFTP
jgi:CubicO group peptidase (beta-lactamase class C family)